MRGGHSQSALKASLAEFVACGGSMREWSRRSGYSQAYAAKLWSSIKRGLGWQAS